MSIAKNFGYAAIARGHACEPIAFDPPELGDHEVRVSITHCGVCHTDIQAIDNYYGITTFPFVPGHEIVGSVVEAGPAVSGVKPGDRVGIGWQGRSCGMCEWCVQGETQLCMEIQNTTVMVPYGGFSTSVVADYRFVYPLPPSMPSPAAAVFMCAGITVYTALKKYAISPGLQTGILGVGGLGHLAIQFAHALGCVVTAISSSPAKREQAFAFGADHFVDANDATNMGKLEYGLDLMLCTANGGINWGPVMSTLKKRGKFILLGFPDIIMNSTDLVAHEISMTGSLIGNPPLMREMLSFAQQHEITPMVELMPMSRVNEAIQRVKENKARYRIVLENDLEGK